MIGRKNITKTIYLAVLFLIMSTCIDISASAEDIDVQLIIDTQNLQTGVSANLTIVIDNVSGGIKLKDIKGLENFDEISSNTTSTTRIVNGNRSEQFRYNYTIFPKAAGDYKLTAYIEHDGKTYESNQLQVHVGEQRKHETNEQDDIYVKTILSKEEAYFGEKIILTYELYSQYRIDSYGFANEMKFDGFITRDLSREQSNFIVIGGEKYVKYEVKRIILTPTTTGILKIPSYNLVVNLETRDFFSTAKPNYFNTEEKEINIKELPTNGKPDNFSGLVGELDISANYNKDEVKYGESITLNVAMSGDSNIEILDKINPQIEGISIYETEKDLREDIINNKYTANKQFELIMVPENTGKIKIKPIHINYFDVNTNSYKQLIINEKIINVTGEKASTIDQVDRSGEVNEKLETVIISQINTTEATSTNEYITIKKQHIYILLVLIVILILIVVIYYFVKNKKSQKDNGLRNIYKSIKDVADDNGYYDIVNEMIKYKYNISIKASSRYEIDKKIDDKEIVRYIFEVMDYMENGYREGNNCRIEYKDIVKKIYRKIS